METNAAYLRNYNQKQAALLNLLFYLHSEACFGGSSCPESSKHCSGYLTGQGPPSLTKCLCPYGKKHEPVGSRQ